MKIINKLIIVIAVLMSFSALNALTEKEIREKYRLLSNNIPEIFYYNKIKTLLKDYYAFEKTLESKNKVDYYIVGNYPTRKLLRMMYRNGVDYVFMYINEDLFPNRMDYENEEN